MQFPSEIHLPSASVLFVHNSWVTMRSENLKIFFSVTLVCRVLQISWLLVWINLTKRKERDGKIPL
jgi:hypothetical protein